MDIKNLSNNELLILVRNKSKEERKLTLEVIELIREVDARRLYLNLAFGSLFEFVTRELGFEEGAAVRRISAARLLKEIPEISQKIAEGNLSLSNLVSAQTFFRNEEKITKSKITVEQKKEILTQLENKSTREAQKTLYSISPQQKVFKESEKVISENLSELKLVMSENLKQKLMELKLHFSNTKPNMNYSELIEKLADQALQKILNQKQRKSPPAQAVARLNKQSSSRYIPALVKRRVWTRDKGVCTYKDPLTKRQCHSRFQLEFHHLEPFGVGGETTEFNLKLLCKKHNYFMAIKDYGSNKMKSFVCNTI